MIDYQKLLIDTFTSDLESRYRETYGVLRPEYASLIAWAGHLALENIAAGDALYHNVEHTMRVTLVGQEILKGKHLREGGVTPDDWLTFTIALLCHDIGYVRGICRGDGDGVYVTGSGDETVTLPDGATDAGLTPYHLDRGKLFVRERFGSCVLVEVDVERITTAMEMTRFPSPDGEFYRNTQDYPGLLRAADFIGQLGDPDYLRKLPALFHEFEETGANERLGYRHPGDIRAGYPRFFWDVVSPLIQDAIRHLRVTLEGRQWVATLHSHVLAVEIEERARLPGAQR